MCSSKITSHDGSCATLACLLNVDMDVYGLTVAHAFSHLAEHSVEAYEHQVDSGPNTNVSDESESEIESEYGIFAVHDIEYETSEEDNIAINIPEVAPSADTDSGHNVTASQLHGSQQFSTMMHFMDSDNPNTPDRDWALVSVPRELRNKPNCYPSMGNNQSPIPLHVVARHHPGSEREVLVLRSLQSPRRGTLLRGSSFIGGINRTGQCEVWNIAFSGPHGLQKGDSGSLVVDIVSNEIYGYLIGLNFMGEAYIMPMKATIDQIKEALKAENVSLPDTHQALDQMNGTPAFHPSIPIPLPSLEQTLGNNEPINHAVSLASVVSEPEVRFPRSHGESAAELSAGPHTIRSRFTPTNSSSSLNSDQVHTAPITSVTINPFTQKDIIEVYEENVPNNWQFRGCDLSRIDTQDVNIVVFFHDIGTFRKHRHHFDEMFWSVVENDVNGDFYCGYEVADSYVTPKVSWSCFKIKEVRATSNYRWIQPAIYVEWDCETGRQLVFIFDFSQSLNDIQRIHDWGLDFQERKTNPFAWHMAFATKILERYDGAYWMLRDLVRVREKNRNPLQHVTLFPKLHDIARHLLHYRETIEVAEHTLHMLALEQEHWRHENCEQFKSKQVLNSWLKTKQGLNLEEKRAHSLGVRIKSLQDRHHNEINLAFNLVSQRTSHTTSSETTKMSSIVFMSMMFLPGTLVSNIFGMNFFSYDSGKFSVSSQFWIYWAAVIPLTLFTVMVWAVWNHQKKARLSSGSKKKPGDEGYSLAVECISEEEKRPKSRIAWMRRNAVLGRNDVESLAPR
ncbi:hypothetical protein BDV06DRAFT_228425 [Aspergillus oleicola]